MSNGATDSDEVALLVTTTESVVEDTPGEDGEAAAASLPSFGDDLPESELRTVDPHMTRPLEPSDLKPAVSGDHSRLAQQIAATLASRKRAQSNAPTLLDQLSASGNRPKAQIRLQPGTTRRKIAGAGVTAEPLVFQSEQSEALLANWADRTLGTNIQTEGDRAHSMTIISPEPAAAFVKTAKPPLNRAVIVTIAIIATLAVAVLAAFFLYPHFASGSSLKIPFLPSH